MSQVKADNWHPVTLMCRDPELSLLMANMGQVGMMHGAWCMVQAFWCKFTPTMHQVSGGSLVLDPFVGTASLLIAAAEFGQWNGGMVKW